MRARRAARPLASATSSTVPESKPWSTPVSAFGSTDADCDAAAPSVCDEFRPSCASSSMMSPGGSASLSAPPVRACCVDWRTTAASSLSCGSVFTTPTALAWRCGMDVAALPWRVRDWPWAGVPPPSSAAKRAVVPRFADGPVTVTPPLVSTIRRTRGFLSSSSSSSFFSAPSPSVFPCSSSISCPRRTSSDTLKESSVTNPWLLGSTRDAYSGPSMKASAIDARWNERCRVGSLNTFSATKSLASCRWRMCSSTVPDVTMR
mmetsp:Transcript_3887/g.12317  ORF Transcript_3887/g.12317 Transcript_3887/m.12317 type:complete len:262 (-) Transcript_3887:337-1122(-)